MRWVFAAILLLSSVGLARPDGLRVMLGQMHVRPGDLRGNLSQAIGQLREAEKRQADLLVLPEGLFPGYPSNDMLFDKDYIERSQLAADALCSATHHVLTAVAFGSVEKNPQPMGRHLQNFGRVCQFGKEIHRQAKVLLPTYGPFDDGRYFEKGSIKGIKPFYIRNMKVVLAICEDLWFYDRQDGRLIYHDNTIAHIRDLNPELVISLSASPWNEGKIPLRHEVHGDVARRVNAPVLWLNQFGVVDQLIFDGSSFGLNAQGKVAFRLASWRPDFEVVSVSKDKTQAPVLENMAGRGRQTSQSEIDQRLSAIEVGVREFAHLINHDSVVFGFSGGLDSTMAAAFAVRALGAENVFAIKMPSDFSSEGSITDTDVLIKNLGIPPENVLTLPIQGVVDAIIEALRGQGIESDDLMSFDGGRVAVENIQARVRMILEFFISNLTGNTHPGFEGVVERLRQRDPRWAKFLSRKAAKLATSDKSELALGNGTIFGDIAGVYAINGDLYKTDLWDLGFHINHLAGREVIPVKILEKEPTAELLKAQLTTDKFPPYRIVDPLLKDLIENHLTPDLLRTKYRSLNEVVSPKFLTPTLVDTILRMYANSEFKRELAQMPTARVSRRSFGKERRTTISVQKYQPFTADDAAACAAEVAAHG